MVFLAHMISVFFKLCNKVPNCFPEWLCYFALPLAVQKSSGCSTSSLALSILSILLLAIVICVQRYCTVPLICISLVVNNFQHLFMCLMAIPIFSLLKCLIKSFTHFLLGRWFIYCWILQVSYIAGHKSFFIFANIFS